MMKRRNKRSLIGKIIIGSVGLLFLLYGCFLIILWLNGIETQAKIISFRRELQERAEVIPNRYTYAYAYEFNVSGEKYSGNSKKIQGPLFLKNQGNSFIKVHYLACCPSLNCPQDDFKPWYKIPIYFVVSLFFGYFMFKIK